MNVVFVTGNPNKAKYFSELVGVSIEHHPADVSEIQSLDLVEIAVHKAKEAYKQLNKPVIVEDAGVYINSMGKLPGPFIKWFIQEIGLEGLCRITGSFEDRSAVASDAFVYFDGREMKYFQGQLSGQISNRPRGSGGYDWDQIFIPDGINKTLAELDIDIYKKYHAQIKPIHQVRDFMLSLDKSKA